MSHRLNTPRLLPGHPKPGRSFRYDQESELLPVTAQWLLRWAAGHIEQVGLFQGRTRFASAGRTVTLHASMLGAFDVAGGYGRQSSRREYDWPAIGEARALALVMLSEHLHGGRLDFPEGADEDRQRYLRRQLVHVWGCAPGRTAAEAAEAFRAAAEEARSEPAEAFATVLESTPVPSVAAQRSAGAGSPSAPGEPPHLV
ncbi:DUF6197 family protein [Kitasatospora sp. NPDC059088]|uniref:DUF6197 family protein n=1 Tax=Kitasatospora sp. NPDC059088 TaxID=3346722 RepID=UPI0036C9232B